MFLFVYGMWASLAKPAFITLEKMVVSYSLEPLHSLQAHPQCCWGGCCDPVAVKGQRYISMSGQCAAWRGTSRWWCSYVSAALIPLDGRGYGFGRCCGRSLGELLQCIL